MTQLWQKLRKHRFMSPFTAQALTKDTMRIGNEAYVHQLAE